MTGPDQFRIVCMVRGGRGVVQGGVARLGPRRGRGQRPGPGGVAWPCWRVDRVGSDGPEMHNSASARGQGEIPGGDGVRMESEVSGALLHLGVVGVASRLVGGQQRLQTAQVAQHLTSPDNNVSYESGH